MLEFSPLPHLIAFGLLLWFALMVRRATGPERLRAARWTVIGVLLAWVGVSSWRGGTPATR